MKRRDWPVDKGIRPAGSPTNCFYCGATKNAQHNKGCVVRARTVVVRATFEYVARVPEDWDAGSIEFRLNESSSCADNILRDIAAEAAKRGCACSMHKGVYLREATVDDEEAAQCSVKDSES